MTDAWAWQLRSRSNCSSARAATGFVTALNDSAISTSSECSRGFRLPRCSVFSAWIGARTLGEMSLIS